MWSLFSRNLLTVQFPMKFFSILILMGINILFNILANIGFKFSAESTTLRGFLIWQVIGNLAGLVTVLTLTFLLRFLPLHVAFPLTTGLSLVGVQVVAAAIFFRESITPLQWLGTLLIAVGVILVWRQ